MAFERPDPDEIHKAEAARVVEGDGLSVVEMHNDVVVLRILRAFVMEFARRRRLRGLDPERARHPKMDDQRFPAVKLEQKIFRAAGKRRNPLSCEALGEAGREGKA